MLKKTLPKLLIATLSSFVISEIILKNIVREPRPTGLCGSDFSFPSAHTAVAFSAACVLAYSDKKRRYLYYGIALLVGLSRIYFQCHYLLDVLVGAVLGYIIGKFILRFKF